MASPKIPNPSHGTQVTAYFFFQVLNTGISEPAGVRRKGARRGILGWGGVGYGLPQSNRGITKVGLSS